MWLILRVVELYTKIKTPKLFYRNTFNITIYPELYECLKYEFNWAVRTKICTDENYLLHNIGMAISTFYAKHSNISAKLELTIILAIKKSYKLHLSNERLKNHGSHF